MSEDRKNIKRALISVYDKTGLDELARALGEAGVEIVSTGSTAKRIAQEIIIDQQQEIAAMKLAIGQPLPPSTPAPTQGGDHHSHMEH